MMTTTDVETVRVEVRELNPDGTGTGEALSWPNSDALKRPRIRFKLEREDAVALIAEFIHGQRGPHYALPISAIVGFELPPVGSLGWTAGRG